MTDESVTWMKYLLVAALANTSASWFLLSVFLSGSLLHSHFPLRYVAGFAHTWCNAARGKGWHHFLPLSRYLSPFGSSGENIENWTLFSIHRHADTFCFDLFRCGWMQVLRYSSPMQLDLDFLRLLEVTILIKMTVTGELTLLQHFVSVHISTACLQISFTFHSGTVSTCVCWTAPPVLWQVLQSSLFWVSWPMNKEWISQK